MNIKKFLISIIAVFLFIFLYEMIVHGFILASRYEATPLIWRSVSDMESKMPLAMCFQLALSVWLTFVFSRIYKEGGVKNGLKFGLFFGVFAGILISSWYLWLPVSATLSWGWFLSNLGQGLGSGAILGSIYRE